MFVENLFYTSQDVCPKRVTDVRDYDSNEQASSAPKLTGDPGTNIL
jgi:hypothetical protein